MTSKTRSILLMIGAIFCFSIMDIAVKASAPNVGVILALWARYTGQMVVVFLLILPRFQNVVRTQHFILQLIRSLMLMAATAFFFTGITLIPLSSAAALMSTNPILITLGATLFLGERLGLRRILGILAAFVGAIIVMRPTGEVFSFGAFFPLIAAFCYSGYALLTRRVGSNENVWTSLFYTGMVGAVVLSSVAPFNWTTPSINDGILLIIVALAGTIGQLALIKAFSEGEASMLAPYSYTGLIFSGVWGVLLFSEIPDFLTVVGIIIILGSGLYVWYRETYAKKLKA